MSTPEINAEINDEIHEKSNTSPSSDSQDEAAKDVAAQDNQAESVVRPGKRIRSGNEESPPSQKRKPDEPSQVNKFLSCAFGCY